METTPATPAPAPTSFALDPKGQLVQVPAEQAEHYRAQGYLPLSEEEAGKVDQQQRFGDSPLKAGLLGAARGATFGLSDLVASQALPAEELKGLSEANPIASGAGHVLGALGPALLTGGESTAAEGALGAGGAARALAGMTPVGAVTRLGEAAGGAARSLVGEGLAGRAVGGLVRGAVETPLYTMGDALTEDVFDNKQLTAEQLLSEAGRGVALGGLTGGLLEGGLGLAGEYLPRAFKQTSRAFDSLAERLEEKAPVVPGVEIPAGAAEVAPRTAASAPATREAPQPFVASNPIDTEAAQRAFRTHLSNAHEGVEDHLGQFFREDKPARIADLIGDQPTTPVAKQLTTEAWSSLQGAKAGSVALNKANDIITETERRIDAASNKAEQFLALDSGKRSIDRLSKFDRTLLPEQLEALRPVREAVGRWRTALEDEGTWGPAGKFQADTNKAISSYYDARKGFASAFLRKGKTAEEGMQAIDAGKVDRFIKLRNAGAARNDDAEKFLAGYTDAGKNLLGTLQETTYGQLPTRAATAKDISTLLGQAGKSGDQAAQALTDAAAVNAANRAGARSYELRLAQHARQLREDAKDFATTQAKATKAHAASESQAAKDYRKQVGSAEKQSGVLAKAERDRVKEAAEPGLLGHVAEELPLVGPVIKWSRKAELLAKAARTASQVSGRLSSGLGSALVGGAGARGGAFAAGLTGHAERLADARDREVRPDAQIEHLAKLAAPLDGHAPQLAGAVRMAALAKEQYLLQQAPQDPRPPNPLAPPTKFKPSPTAQARYERVERAVMHPESLVEDLRAGRVAPEAVAAVKATSPELYAQMATELQQRIAEHVGAGKLLDGAQQTQISLFLGQPISQPMQMLAHTQAQFAAAPAPPPTAMSSTGRTRVSGLAKLSGASRAASPFAKEQS